MKKAVLATLFLILIGISIYWFYPKQKVDLSNYSDPDYANYVELQAFLMTPEQVAELFATNPNGIPAHWTIDDAPKPDPKAPWAKHASYLEPLYLVIRIKNTGSKYIWGTLTCELPNGGSIEIETLCFKPNDTNFQNLVRRIYSGGIFHEDLKVTNPRALWKDIYSKPNEDM